MLHIHKSWSSAHMYTSGGRALVPGDGSTPERVVVEEIFLAVAVEGFKLVIVHDNDSGDMVAGRRIVGERRSLCQFFVV